MRRIARRERGAGALAAIHLHKVREWEIHSSLAGSPRASLATGSQAPTMRPAAGSHRGAVGRQSLAMSVRVRGVACLIVDDSESVDDLARHQRSLTRVRKVPRDFASPRHALPPSSMPAQGCSSAHFAVPQSRHFAGANQTTSPLDWRTPYPRTWPLSLAAEVGSLLCVLTPAGSSPEQCQLTRLGIQIRVMPCSAMALTPPSTMARK